MNPQSQGDQLIGLQQLYCARCVYLVLFGKVWCRNVCFVQVGPAGSQFGLLACLMVEVIHCWQMLRNPSHALLKLVLIVLFLFVFGLLPWVDNFAHLFGFIFGFLLSFALLPFVSFGDYDRQKKIFLIWVSCLSYLILNS